MGILRDIYESNHNTQVWVGDRQSLSWDDGKWRLTTTKGRHKGNVETISPSRAARIIYVNPGGRLAGGWDWIIPDSAADLSLVMTKLKNAPVETKTAIADLIESHILPLLRGEDPNAS